VIGRQEVVDDRMEVFRLSVRCADRRVSNQHVVSVMIGVSRSNLIPKGGSDERVTSIERMDDGLELAGI
jgi:hypothetical protein